MTEKSTLTTSISSVEHSDASLTLEWADGHKSDYPMRWLRYDIGPGLCRDEPT